MVAHQSRQPFLPICRYICQRRQLIHDCQRQAHYSLDANITAITRIPKARLIISCKLEASLIKRSQNLSEYNGTSYAFNVSENSNEKTGGSIYDGNSYTAIYPVAYLDLNNEVHPFTAAEAENPDFAHLIRKSGMPILSQPTDMIRISLPISALPRR